MKTRRHTDNADTRLVIASVGMTTAIGLTAKDTYYAMQAGVSRIQESSLLDVNRNPIVMATLPTECLQASLANLHPSEPLLARLLGLFELTCDDVKQQHPKRASLEPLPLYIALPKKLSSNDCLDCFFNVGDQHQISFDSITAFLSGRAAALIALNQAIEAIQTQSTPAVWVAGCDSCLDIMRLTTLEAEGRLKTPANMDGLIPGEGAALLLLTTQGYAQQQGLPMMAEIKASQGSFEPGHLYTDASYRGDGLASCITQLLAQETKTTQIDAVYSSLNGEDYWIKEWGVSYIRNHQHFQCEYDMHHPAEFFGDTGAACGALLAALAASYRFETKQAVTSLVYAASDHGQRSALLLT